ncbi:MAG TPA: hypothetical protein ENI81_09995 [Phycisphaerales bacterium]|nr:hypothetical protein [Phycisphaerales bacterium]
MFPPCELHEPPTDSQSMVGDKQQGSRNLTKHNFLNFRTHLIKSGGAGFQQVPERSQIFIPLIHVAPILISPVGGLPACFSQMLRAFEQSEMNNIE